MIQIRHLSYFVAVAREMNFTRAAKQLHIAQPALSQNIQQIEQEIGAQLFVRQSDHKLAMTAVGRVFYKEALRTLERVEEMKQNVQCAARGENSSLAIGYTVSCIGGELPRKLQQFHESHPEVRLITKESLLDLLMAQLHHEQLDIICVDSTVTDSTLDSKSMAPLPLAVALNWKHRLAGDSSPLPLAELAGESFILPTAYKDYILYSNFVELCREAGFEPRCEHFTDSVPGGIGLVAANLGVDLMHELPMLRCPKEVVVRRIYPTVPLRMCVAWRKGDTNDLIKKFIDLI